MPDNPAMFHDPSPRFAAAAGGQPPAAGQAISDDPGTVLESCANVAEAIAAARRASASPGGAAGHRPAAAAEPRKAEEVLYRSPYKGNAARITICDDGSLEEGEVVYVRSDRVVIGRSKGDILVPHDAAMSGCHAEVARVDLGGRQGWVLRDLASSNGTLVRCSDITLRPGLTVLIGSRRYRFELPIAALRDDPEEEMGTMLIGSEPAVAPDALPALVESSPPGDRPPLRHPFRGVRVTIGRPGLGNDVELDDLCVAARHAVVTRDPRGAWQMRAEPSLNGIWARVNAVELTPSCLFQCGEQRFRFHE